MSSVATHPLLAAGDTQRPASYGDAGMVRLFQTYFNGRNAAPYDLGAGRFDGRDHYQLVDSDRVTEDMGIVIREVNIDYLTWVNRDLMPSRVSNDIEFEVTVIHFDKDVMVEQTPEAAVSRYMDIRRENLSFRSKRYGLAMYFEVDRMMTEEGQKDFAMFTKKIAIAFRMHAAFIALSRLLMPDSTERHWYAQYGQHPQHITEAQIMREVAEFAAAHKSESGVFQMIWQYAAAFQRQNTVRPDFVIFRPEKQALFKFNNEKLNEYSRAGPAGPDRMMGAEEIANFQGMSFRGFPSFPSMCYNENEAETSMLAHDVEIGNFFTMRRRYFANIDGFKSGVHNYVEIFSENKDGMHRIYERELLRHWGRWDEYGNLDETHQKLADLIHPPGKDVDLFLYYDTQIGRHQVCTHIGDMEVKWLDRQLLADMVKDAIKDFPDLDGVRKAVADLEASDDVTQLPKFASFAAFVGRKLGGSRNPAFNGARNPTVDSKKFSAAEKSALTFLDNCFLFHPQADTDVSVGDELIGLVDKFRHLVKELAADQDQISGDDLNALVQFDMQLRRLIDNYGASYLTSAKTLTMVINTMTNVVEHRGRLVPQTYEAVKQATQILADLNDKAPAAAAGGEDEQRAPPRFTDGNGGRGRQSGYRETGAIRVNNIVKKGTPLHFAGYLPEPTGRSEYNDIPTGVFDDASIYSFGGSTMQQNVAHVMEAYPDPIERGVALAILAAPIQLGVLETMLSFNIQIPIEYLIARPNHHLLMSDLLLCKGGRELGETIVGYGHTAIGWKTENKTGDLHTTQWMGALIRNYALRCIIRNVFHEESYGGGGHTFFTREEWDAHVAHNFSTPGYDRPSLVCMFIPVGSHVKEDYIFLTGRGPADQEGSRPHYESYMYYTMRFSWTSIGNESASVIYDAGGVPRTNGVCFQGTQRQCGNVNGDPGDYVENKGHLGIERPGERDVRKQGLKLKPRLV